MVGDQVLVALVAFHLLHRVVKHFPIALTYLLVALIYLLVALFCLRVAWNIPLAYV